MSSQRLNSEGEVRPSLRDDVALLPEQAQQQVLGVSGPAVDPGVLEPGGDVSLCCIGKQHRNQPEVQTALLDVLILNLVVNVFGVEAMLIISSLSLHVCLVLGADGHDDEH